MACAQGQIKVRAHERPDVHTSGESPGRFIPVQRKITERLQIFTIAHLTRDNYQI